MSLSPAIALILGRARRETVAGGSIGGRGAASAGVSCSNTVTGQTNERD